MLPLYTTSNNCIQSPIPLLLTFSPAKIRWLSLEKISGYNSRMQSFEAPRTVAIACFYVSVFLFFEVAWEYCSEMLYPTGKSGCRREKGSILPSPNPPPHFPLRRCNPLVN